MLVEVVCTQCRRRFRRERGQLNRALKASPGKLYCSRKCTGLARRDPGALHRQPLDVRRAKKAAYDVRYRTLNLEEIREKKREYHKRSYTYEKAREKREATKRRRGKHYHRDLCRRRFERNPALRRGKRLSDRARRYRLGYGEFRECAALLWKLEREISARYPSGYERRKARGYYTLPRSTQERKRNEGISRW